MAWIELHDTLPDHPKVAEAAELLKLDKDAVVGKLVRLWVWALNNRENGRISFRDISTVAEIMRYRGKPSKLIDTLVSVRLMDVTDEGYVIHDWQERVGMLMAKRETKREQDRLRQQRRRDKAVTKEECHADVTRDNAVTSRVIHAVTVPYLNHTIPDDDDVYIVKVCDIEAALADGEPQTKINALVTGLIKAELGKTHFELDEDEIGRLCELACDHSCELVVGEAIKAAHAARATVPVKYIERCLKTWEEYGVDTPERLKEAQPYLAVISSRTVASKELKSSAEEKLDKLWQKYSSDPYSRRSFLIWRESQKGG